MTSARLRVVIHLLAVPLDCDVNIIAQMQPQPTA